MPDKVITSIDQVTTRWLTSVLAARGALINGAVAAFDVDPGRGNWSTNARLNLRYTAGSQGALPRRLFLKMVNTDLANGSFDSSEVNYYTRDYEGVAGAPLVPCYDAAFSGQLKRYHILLDDLSETHIEASEKAPTLAYGLALADGLAAIHARWWAAGRFLELGAAMHTAGQIQRFVDASKPGAAHILDHFQNELKPHWPDAIRTLYARHPQALISRTQDDNGFTLIHGDAGCYNILVPRQGDQPIYLIDRQPFDWSLTTWLGVYDLAYALVLDWEIELRRRFEADILRRYHEQLTRNGVGGYTWEQLLHDYRLCVATCVYVAAEYFTGSVDGPWIPIRLLKLQRSLTACDDLHCDELW